jgi:hypothetical protein
MVLAEADFWRLLDLVWSGIGENVATLSSVFWENPEIVDELNVFRRVSWGHCVSFRGRLLIALRR